MSNQFIKKRFLTFLIIIFFFRAESALCYSASQHNDGSDAELISHLNEFRSLLQKSHYIDALQTGYGAAHNENIFNNANFSAQESLLFEVAVFHLEYIGKINNTKQAKRCAEKAAALWKKYIDWFDNLSNEQRSTMHNSHIRIYEALTYLGNSLIRKGDIFQLLDCYMNIATDNLSYFGPDAITVWKNALYGCPDGNVKKLHTVAARRNSIQNGCDEHWNNYAATLKEWVTIALLKNSAKTSYLREIDQIEKEITHIGDEE